MKKSWQTVNIITAQKCIFIMLTHTDLLFCMCTKIAKDPRVWGKWIKHDKNEKLADYMSVHVTRNSSGYEIANVNFFYDDIVYVLQNTIDSCINSATDRRGYVLERMFTKISEITQYNSHYVVQGHSRSPILVPIESSYTTSY